jgi:malonate decarboxylase alpha subunit
MSDTSLRRANRASRLARAAALSGTSGKVYPADRATQLLEAIIEPGDRVAIEGDNQKQADFRGALRPTVAASHSSIPRFPASR